LVLFAALALPAPAQAACDFLGTAARDKLRVVVTGNDKEVVICPAGGNDEVTMAAPIPTGDILFVVNAGSGNDKVIVPDTFTGKVEVRGGAGNDIVQGGSGPDLLNGGLGADILRGGPGPDLLLGGRGVDRVLGQAGNDTIKTGPGAKEIAKGGPGADNVDGRQEPIPHIVEICVDHVGPGKSYIVVNIKGAPGTDFLVFLNQIPVADRDTGPTGQTEVRIPISQYGTYEVSLSLSFFTTPTQETDKATVNVTPAEGCTPDPD
jgi:Ca2+-binding RTX toxin-like protein